MSHTYLSDCHAVSLLHLLVAKRGLLRLIFTRVPLGSRALEVIADSMQHSQPRLEHVSLVGCWLDDASAFPIARSLRTNQTLKVLKLSHNSLGDHTALTLAESLQNNRSLVELRLRGNCIGSSGAVALANVLGPVLQGLDLWLNPIGHVGVQAVRARSTAYFTYWREHEQIVNPDSAAILFIAFRYLALFVWVLHSGIPQRFVMWLQWLGLIRLRLAAYLCGRSSEDWW